MKELLLAPHLLTSACLGDKQLTIRNGIRDFDPGDQLKLVDTNDPNKTLEREITQVLKFSKSALIPLEYIQADGFDDFSDMVNQMKDFYPDFNGTSPVTIICWE